MKKPHIWSMSSKNRLNCTTNMTTQYTWLISKHISTPWQSTLARTSSSYLHISTSSGSKCFSEVKILSFATKTLNAASLSLVFVISFSHSRLHFLWASSFGARNFQIPMPFVLLLVPQPNTAQLPPGMISPGCYISSIWFQWILLSPEHQTILFYKRNNATKYAI